MSPYIVTAKRRWDDAATNTGGFSVESRLAVATLDEARAFVGNEIADVAANTNRLYPALDKQHRELSESGGTVGPFPDGTVIEVAPTTTDALREAVEISGYGSWPDCDPSDDEIIYAYNAAQNFAGGRGRE